MNRRIQSVAVLGLGKIGFLVAELLNISGFSVTGADITPQKGKPFKTVEIDVTNPGELAGLVCSHDAVVSCLPYTFNLTIASIAHENGIHYFDLTEDVPTTRAIIEMSKNSTSIMAPQCGLAPGFIGIVGASLAADFDKIRSIKLRVGALPQHPTGLLGYAFNWSPEGVVNEYLNDCEVIEDGTHKWVSPMEWLEQLVINGVPLEAFTTSGGLGTMCQSFLGRVENLDYKSVRYPGHCQLMNFFFHELLMREQRELAGRILTNAKPSVNDDVVYIHATAEGWKKERLFRDEFVRSFYPIAVNGTTCRAIAWTTAASVCSVVELVANGSLPATGFLKQEEIPLQKFLQTQNGKLYGNLE
ncbi:MULTISPECIES: saccharopine dehydrogenase family protein [Desulfosediminicola]|uniref:saccharopine dehydrogenase family protein n=1 Tax=Desulfosediminicola TaxID=2886823 RepID=UPI0010AB688F|nr:saccharopine dehydrogenase C-terminal domain-containing protein [Desulfosediminicola ganghwensis]